MKHIWFDDFEEGNRLKKAEDMVTEIDKIKKNKKEKIYTGKEEKLTGKDFLDEVIKKWKK